jgi:hypothetical protein
MIKKLFFYFIIFFVASCAKKHEVIFINNSNKPFYLIDADSDVSNYCIFNYYHNDASSNGVTFNYTENIVYPGKFKKNTFYSNMFDKKSLNHKFYVFFLKADSLPPIIQIKLDSTLIKKYLLKKVVFTPSDILKNPKLEIIYP